MRERGGTHRAHHTTHTKKRETSELQQNLRKQKKIFKNPIEIVIEVSLFRTHSAPWHWKRQCKALDVPLQVLQFWERLRLNKGLEVLELCWLWGPGLEVHRDLDPPM